MGRRPLAAGSLLLAATAAISLLLAIATAGAGARNALIAAPVPLPLGPGPVVISRIVGELQLCGGPAPGRCRVEGITSCVAGHGCVKDDRVRIVQNGSTVDTVRLRKGRFGVTVSPGRYTVQLLADGTHVHEVIQSKTVVAPRYGTAHVTFTIAVP